MKSLLRASTRWLLLGTLLLSGSPLTGLATALAAGPAITTNPTASTLRPGSSAVFAVAATGTAPLTFQWYEGETGDTSAPVPGATGPLLVTPALRTTTDFWVRISNAEASTASPTTTATLTTPYGSLELGAVGDNRYGQLGDSSTTDRLPLTPIVSGVRFVSVGSDHTLFVKTDGTLFAAGYNHLGQLGDGSYTDRAAPVPIATNVASVSAGYNHTLFVKTDGSLWAMGNNATGVYGDGSTTSSTSPVPVATGVASISTGISHTLIVKTDGSLWATGYNHHGQLGDGTLTERTTPVRIASEVVSASAGLNQSYFVKTDGSLWATGQNEYGQLGDGTKTQRITPVLIATNVASVAAGSAHTLFVKTDGSLWGMGANYAGQLGIGSTTDSSTPVPVAAGVVSAATGYAHSLFIKTDGSLWAMGGNHDGQLGDGTTTGRTTPVQVASQVDAVSAGYNHTLFLGALNTVTFDLGLRGTRTGGGELIQRVFRGSAAVQPTLTTAAGWAFNGWDVSLTAVSTDFTATAQYVVPTPPVISTHPASVTILRGSPATLSVTATSNAQLIPLDYQWFWGETGDISSPMINATDRVVVTPELTTTSRFWVRVSNIAGLVDSPAATVTVTYPPGLTLLGFGSNAYGQFGHDDHIGAWGPHPIASGITSVHAGPGYTLYIKADASLWSMGYNDSGQLGDGSTITRRHPVLVSTDAIAAAAGSSHALFVKTDGSLWGMGFNGWGQLGDGTTDNRLRPVHIATNVVAVAAGDSHSLFLRGDGSLWGMGSNYADKLGYHPEEFSLIWPAQIADNVRSFAAGSSSTFFIKTDDTLWALGNANGGDPVLIAPRVRSVSTGGDHTLFVKTDGTLWAMGHNHYGQLGDGTQIHRDFPVQIATDVATASAGTWHSLFAKTDGTLWSMGRNHEGQLGDTNTLPRAIPVQIATGVSAVSAGRDSSFALSRFGFATWAAVHGLRDHDARPDADPDTDGVPNLLEFIFGTSPLTATRPPAATPVGRVEKVGGLPHLVFTHRRSKDPLACNFYYEKSTDLAEWLAFEPGPFVVDPDPDGNGSVELVRIVVPFDSEPRLFIRLQAME